MQAILWYSCLFFGKNTETLSNKNYFFGYNWMHKKQNASYFLYSTSHDFKTATDSWKLLALLRVQNLFREFFLRATLRNDLPSSETLRASFSRTSPHSDSSAVNTLTCVFCLTAAPPERVKPYLIALIIWYKYFSTSIKCCIIFKRGFLACNNVFDPLYRHVRDMPTTLVSP